MSSAAVRRRQLYLTKSLFKKACQCPRKLQYAINPERYPVKSLGAFAEGLADEGKKIGAYSRLMYPEGIVIGTNDQHNGNQISSTASDAEATAKKFSSMTVFQLKDELRKKGMKLSGRKSELILRLMSRADKEDHKTMDDLVEETRSLLLANDMDNDVTIFEGAVRSGPFLIRADILVKMANTTELRLVEAKAKSWDSSNDRNQLLLGKRGKSIQANYLKYIQDVAFQKMVVQQAFPDFKVTSWLLMPDKAKLNTQIPNLNSLFQKQKETNSRNAADFFLDEKSRNLILASGESLMELVNVDDVVEMVLNGKLNTDGKHQKPFRESVRNWADSIINGNNASCSNHLPPPPIGAQCRKCEYRKDALDSATVLEKTTPKLPGDEMSPFDKCWLEATGSMFDKSKRPVVDLHYGGSKIDKYIAAQKYYMEDLSSTDLGLCSDGTDKKNRSKVGMTRAQRQWYQIAGTSSSKSYSVDSSNIEVANGVLMNWDYIRDEMATWKFPFHFLDFETSATALPYSTGKTPFQQIAFQFSHHVLNGPKSDVEHMNQFLHAVPGECPNAFFLDALAKAMSDGGGDSGTVFRWGAHENTVLSQLLREQDPKSVERAEVLEPLLSGGSRAMVDLMQVATKGYFVAGSGGSSSIKKLLLPTMRASEKLGRIYGQPTYSSPNFSNMQWRQEETIGDRSTLRDPYSLLAPREDGDEVVEGGEAIIAYNILQQRNTSAAKRSQIEASLLRYCELDTLAMAMIVQAWQGFLDE